MRYRQKGGVFVFAWDYAHFKKPVISMNIFSTEYMSDSSLISYIITYNNNTTRWRFQAYHMELLEQRGINKVGRKQAQKIVQGVNSLRYGRQTHKST